MAQDSANARSLSKRLLFASLFICFALSQVITQKALGSEGWQPKPGVLLAQADVDDAYDPFADYSEFEESADEEEDIHFFRHGRLLTMGFMGGYRAFTNNLGSLYAPNPTFGLFISYFFDLRFAIQFGFLTSDHALSLTGPGYEPIMGNVSVSDLSFNLKYYLNTQNVTRGLADLNPYLIGGFSQIYRTTTQSGVDEFAKDSAFGFDIGAGLELPMMRNKMFFGGQFMYQLVSFGDEGRTIIGRDNLDNDVDTGFLMNGDTWNFLGVLGVNF